MTTRRGFLSQVAGALVAAVASVSAWRSLATLSIKPPAHFNPAELARRVVVDACGTEWIDHDSFDVWSKHCDENVPAEALRDERIATALHITRRPFDVLHACGMATGAEVWYVDGVIRAAVVSDPPAWRAQVLEARRALEEMRFVDYHDGIFDESPAG
jgi:hypothetical protein